MNMKQFERRLARRTPWSESDLDQRTRRLREARMLPQGGRGLNAPDIAAEHAATLLIALAASDTAAGSQTSAAAYAALRAVDGEGFAGAETFGEALTAVLTDDNAFLCGVVEVAVNRSWPLARVVIKRSDGAIREYAYGYSDSVAAQAAGFSIYTMHVETHYSGGFLHQIAIDLRHVANNDAGA